MIGLGYNPKGFSVVKHYDDDYNGNSEIGDLFMVASNFKGVYHAGVCYDEEMIVQFMSKTYFIYTTITYRNSFKNNKTSSFYIRVMPLAGIV